MYESRNFAIFSTTEIDKIDFSQVCETSAETLRRSVSGTKTFVKWDQGPYDPTPYEITNAETLTTLEGIYSYTEILEILSGEEWVSIMEGM
jgi:hypothetical protein